MKQKLVQKPLEVGLIHKKDMWCDEMIYATVGTCLAGHYELMFHDYWNFSYLDDPTLSVSRRVQYFDPHVRKNLEKYYGVRIHSSDAKDQAQMLQKIEEELQNNRPCMALFDCHYSEWSNSEERKNHNQFPYLIIGETEDHTGYIVRDPHNDDALKKAVTISKETFLKGCCSYETFSTCQPEYKIENIGDFLRQTAKTVRANNIFENLKNFAKAIGQGIDFAAEIEGLQDPQQAPIINVMISMARSRELYSSMLYSLAKTYGESRLFKIAEEFSVISGLWHMEKAFLLKCFVYKRFTQKDCEKLAGKIAKIADDEEKICTDLENYQSRSDDKKQEQHLIDKDRDSIISVLDLRPYFNSRACYSEVSADSPADITGVGEYLLVDQKYANKTIRLGSGAVFRFPQITADDNDNLVCSGQIVKTESCAYRQIYFLACCDYDDFAATLTLQYADGEENAVLSVSNFWSERPQYGEQVALEFKKVEVKNQTTVIDDRLYRIYCCIKKVNPQRKLVGIRLPSCPNMHIFAISLVVE